MQKFFLLPLVASLVGCASVTTGSHQNVSVETHPVSGAECRLSNDDGTWFVPSTPGSVTIDRAYSDLSVTCEKPGYGRGTAVVKSSTKGVAFGNIIAGGVIGAAVDMGSGAAYDYPSLITVSLKPERGASSKKRK